MILLTSFCNHSYCQLWKLYADSANILSEQKKITEAIKYDNKALNILSKDSLYTGSYIQICKNIGDLYFSESLNLSSSSIYKMTANRTIPTMRREGSKKLMFSRSQLASWLSKSQKSQASNLNLVDEHLHKKIQIHKAQIN